MKLDSQSGFIKQRWKLLVLLNRGGNFWTITKKIPREKKTKVYLREFFRRLTFMKRSNIFSSQNSIKIIRLDKIVH